jgi:hypothetical protein
MAEPARQPLPLQRPNAPGTPHDTSQRPNSAAALWAAWRQGLKDLQNVVLNPFPPGHVAQHEEIGSIANPTQREVYQEGHGAGPSPRGVGASMSDATPQAAASKPAQAPSAPVPAQAAPDLNDTAEYPSPAAARPSTPTRSGPSAPQANVAPEPPETKHTSIDPLDQARQTQAQASAEQGKDRGMSL